MSAGDAVTRYVCDFCGHEGTVPFGSTTEQVQCPMCGEPVTELRGP